ncbi:restriction endonuclease subunit S [Leptothoe sp. EHU-05/26/07-4]
MASRRQVALENSAKIDLGKLPSLWERALLADVSELQCGYAFKSKWFSDSGIRLLRGTNIVPGGLRWEDIAYLPEERILEFSEYRLEQDDIVIAMDRPLISSGLKIARLSAEDLPALLLQRVGRFKMTQAMLSDYLLIFLRSWIFITHIGGQATGTQLPHISATDIKTAPIPLPPLNEQHRIVTKIEALTTRSCKARVALDAIPPLLDQFRQSVLAAAFRGDLTADWRAQNPDVETINQLLQSLSKQKIQGKSTGRAATTNIIPGRAALSVGDPETNIPSTWQRVHLLKIARLESGHTPSRKHPEYWGGDIPWIGIQDARENHGQRITSTFQYTNELGLENSAARLLPRGTVCLSRTASVGYALIMGKP